MSRRIQRNRTALVPVDVLGTFSCVDSIGFEVERRLACDLFAEIRASLDLDDFVRWTRAVGADPTALLEQFERDMNSRRRVKLKGGE